MWKRNLNLKPDRVRDNGSGSSGVSPHTMAGHRASRRRSGGKATRRSCCASSNSCAPETSLRSILPTALSCQPPPYPAHRRHIWQTALSCQPPLYLLLYLASRSPILPTAPSTLYFRCDAMVLLLRVLSSFQRQGCGVATLDPNPPNTQEVQPQRPRLRFDPAHKNISKKELLRASDRTFDHGTFTSNHAGAAGFDGPARIPLQKAIKYLNVFTEPQSTFRALVAYTYLAGAARPDGGAAVERGHLRPFKVDSAVNPMYVYECF